MKGNFVRGGDTDPSSREINAETPLYPFRKSPSEFVTSDDVLDTKVYGYTYPDIAAAGQMSEERLSRFVMDSVWTLYAG